MNTTVQLNIQFLFSAPLSETEVQYLLYLPDTEETKSSRELLEHSTFYTYSGHVSQIQDECGLSIIVGSATFKKYQKYMDVLYKENPDAINIVLDEEDIALPG